MLGGRTLPFWQPCCWVAEDRRRLFLSLQEGALPSSALYLRILSRTIFTGFTCLEGNTISERCAGEGGCPKIATGPGKQGELLFRFLVLGCEREGGHLGLLSFPSFSGAWGRPGCSRCLSHGDSFPGPGPAPRPLFTMKTCLSFGHFPGAPCSPPAGAWRWRNNFQLL